MLYIINSNLIIMLYKIIKIHNINIPHISQYSQNKLKIIELNLKLFQHKTWVPLNLFNIELINANLVKYKHTHIKHNRVNLNLKFIRKNKEIKEFLSH